MAEVRTVVVAAADEGWEPEAVRRLSAAGLVVIRSAIDLAELLALAATGSVDVAVVAAGLVDADALRALAAERVAVVAVGDVIGVRTISRVQHVVAAVRGAAPEDRTIPGSGRRVLAVWGPAGAPGRTTLALALAVERSRQVPVVLVDADVYGGAVATYLGMGGERSGLLAAARRATGPGLGAADLEDCLSPVAPRLEVLTGLPHGDRWVALRPGILDRVIELASRRGEVVLDCGFDLEQEVGLGPLERNGATIEVLRRADEVVAVGRGDAVGLARLQRGIEDLAGLGIGVRRVVLNRVSEPAGVAGIGAQVHIVPDEPRQRQDSLAVLAADCFSSPAYG